MARFQIKLRLQEAGIARPVNGPPASRKGFEVSEALLGEVEALDGPALTRARLDHSRRRVRKDTADYNNAYLNRRHECPDAPKRMTVETTPYRVD